MQVIYIMEVTKMLFKIQKYFNCDYFNNKAPRRSSLKHYACRVKTVKKTDQRVGVMNEVICSMQVAKMYTWEDSFGSLVKEIRK